MRIFSTIVIILGIALIVMFGLILHAACTMSDDAIDVLVMFSDRHEDESWSDKECRMTRCNYYDGFGCTRSDVAQEDDEECPCDIKMYHVDEVRELMRKDQKETKYD